VSATERKTVIETIQAKLAAARQELENSRLLVCARLTLFRRIGRLEMELRDLQPPIQPSTRRTKNTMHREAA
jgi:hypothetical protein